MNYLAPYILQLLIGLAGVVLGAAVMWGER